MKHLVLISITLCSLVITGCGDSDALGYNGAELCDNAAQPFDALLDTFLVTDDMYRTSSWDYLQGIQPSELVTDEVQGMINQMEELINEFAVYKGPVTNIKSLDNPLDTMEQTIANDAVGNIQNGKRQIRQAINDNVACTYNNPDAFLRDAADTDKFYRYTLDYTFVSRDNTLKRTTAYSEKIDDIKVFKATNLTALDPATFSSTGYNPPLASTLSWFDNETYTLTLTKNYQSKADSSAYESAAPFTVGENTKVKRFRVAIDYRYFEAKIYTSNFLSATSCFAGTGNPIILEDPTLQDFEDINCTLADRIPYIDPGYGFVGDTDPIPLRTYRGSEVTSRL